MKRQSIYIDPAILKKKNLPDNAPEGKSPQIMAPQKQKEQPHTEPSQPKQNLLEQKKSFPDDPKEEMFGSRRQMQNDLKYTSAMKKDKTVKKDEAGKKVDQISDRSDNVLIKMKTVFPFDFFPSTITVDANKITIIDKTFFASETVTAILLEEITDVVVQSNFFLGQLIITYSHHPLQPLHYKIPTLKKREALKAQEIIQGLLVLRISEGIDLSKLQPDEITKELANIGQTHENIPSM